MRRQQTERELAQANADLYARERALVEALINVLPTGAEPPLGYRVVQIPGGLKVLVVHWAVFADKLLWRSYLPPLMYRQALAREWRKLLIDIPALLAFED